MGFLQFQNQLWHDIEFEVLALGLPKGCKSIKIFKTVVRHFQTPIKKVFLVKLGLLVVVLIKIWSRNQAGGEQELDNLEQNDFEATNAFSGGLSVLHIEGDPFANDFQENKLIENIWFINSMNNII